MKHALIAALMLVLVACSHEPPPYESKYTEPTATPQALPPFDVTSVNAALSAPDVYKIAVLGDSTGNAPNEWVHLLAGHIATAYGRQVTVRGWNVDTNTYDTATTYGTGAPVDIFNASGAGKPASWSVEHFPAMVPEPVNLTIINHSHNNPDAAAAGVRDLVVLAKGKTLPGGGIAVTLQNPRTDNQATRGQNAIDTLRSNYSNPGGPIVIDVNEAFRSANRPDLLQADGAHPNDQGSQIWLTTVLQALQLR